jgi:hypothetical protein
MLVPVPDPFFFMDLECQLCSFPNPGSIFGLFPSSGILETRKQRFGNWMCFRPQVRGETPILLGSLERAYLSHWVHYLHVNHLMISVRNYSSRKFCVAGRNFQRHWGDSIFTEHDSLLTSQERWSSYLLINFVVTVYHFSRLNSFLHYEAAVFPISPAPIKFWLSWQPGSSSSGIDSPRGRARSHGNHVVYRTERSPAPV